jgi:sulfide:quinone oxidoreductase
VGKHIVILGAGFGGLELSSCLSDEFGDETNVTLIDKNDYLWLSKFG